MLEDNVRMWAVWSKNKITGNIGHGTPRFTKAESEELIQAVSVLVKGYEYWVDTVPSSALLRGIDVPQG